MATPSHKRRLVLEKSWSWFSRNRNIICMPGDVLSKLWQLPFCRPWLIFSSSCSSTSFQVWTSNSGRGGDLFKRIPSLLFWNTLWLHWSWSRCIRSFQHLWDRSERKKGWHKSNFVLQAWQDNWDDGVEGDLNQMQILKGGLGAGDIQEEDGKCQPWGISILHLSLVFTIHFSCKEPRMRKGRTITNHSTY